VLKAPKLTSRSREFFPQVFTPSSHFFAKTKFEIFFQLCKNLNYMALKTTPVSRGPVIIKYLLFEVHRAGFLCKLLIVSGTMTFFSKIQLSEDYHYFTDD
jgi:hypothetical protein